MRDDGFPDTKQLDGFLFSHQLQRAVLQDVPEPPRGLTCHISIVICMMTCRFLSAGPRSLPSSSSRRALRSSSFGGSHPTRPARRARKAQGQDYAFHLIHQNAQIKGIPLPSSATSIAASPFVTRNDVQNVFSTVCPNDLGLINHLKRLTLPFPG